MSKMVHLLPINSFAGIGMDGGRSGSGIGVVVLMMAVA
jgi:hypothetical protein